MSSLLLRCYRVPRADVVWSNEPYIAEKGRNESGLKWRLTRKANLLYSTLSVERCLSDNGMRPGDLTKVPTKQTHRYPFYMSLHPFSRPAFLALSYSVPGATCFRLEAWISNSAIEVKKTPGTQSGDSFTRPHSAWLHYLSFLKKERKRKKWIIYARRIEPLRYFSN